jgi:mannosyl-3-phosphoglycerate phosphatase
MLAPRVVIFTPSKLLGPPTHLSQPASEVLTEIERRNVPLVLSTRGTRAQLEPLRRKIGHAHPFITEGGGGLFIPDGYFALRLEGARRVGRYLCVPFGRSSREAAAALEDIAREVGADVVRYAEMKTREIARNTGMTEREAEESREREFSERFFFAGNTDLTASSFERIAGEHNWRIRRGQPFWELYSGNDEGKAVRYLMRLYREALRSRIRSVGIGASMEDASLLEAADQAFILPVKRDRFDEQLVAKLPNTSKINVAAAAGWSQTVLKILNHDQAN